MSKKSLLELQSDRTVAATNPMKKPFERGWIRVSVGILGVLALGCGGSGTKSEAVAEAAPAEPPPTERNVTCKFTGAKQHLRCADAADCPDEGAEVICRDGLTDFFVAPDNTEINNWIQDKTWDRKKGAWTLVDTEGKGYESELSWDGTSHKGLAVTSHRASVLLVGAAVPNHSLRGPILAFAQFVEYQEGLVFDDVALEAGAVFTGKDAELQRTALSLHRALKGASDMKDLRVGGTLEELIGDLWVATEGLDVNDRKALLVMDGTTASEVVRKHDEVKAKRLETTRPTFEQDPWARASAVALPWDEAFENAVSEHGWALPGATSCRGKPSSGDADEIKAEEARRSEYLGEISRIARILPVEVRAKAEGSVTDVPTELFGAHDFTLSGRASMASTPSCGPECCNVFTGDCEVRLFGCESDEVTRTICGPPEYDWKITGVPERLTLSAPATVTKDSVVDGVEGEAIVVVDKAFQVCEEDAFLSRQLTGQVVAYRVKDKATGATLAQVVKRDVSVDEALAGPEAFHFKPAKK